MFKIIDNFLNKEEFKIIEEQMTNDRFPWYFNKHITTAKKDDDSFYYFSHCFYENPFKISEFFYSLNCILQKINFKSITRVKGNLYTSEKRSRKHNVHVDRDYSHKGCLFYINTNNGFNYFKNEKVKPVANRVVFFDPSEKHCSSSCTDAQRRVTINFNYF